MGDIADDHEEQFIEYVMAKRQGFLGHHPLFEQEADQYPVHRTGQPVAQLKGRSTIMATGESKRLQYAPGMERPESKPVEEGSYQLSLADKGKPGLKGWTMGKTPKKFPYRMVKYAITGTTDEITEKEKTLRDFISANPKAFFRVFDLAAASGYPEQIDVEMPSKPSDPETKLLCLEIDKVVDYIEENGIVLNAYLAVEEYQGRSNNKIQRFEPPGSETVTEEETEEEAEEEVEAEEEAPKPAAKKPPAKTMLAKKSGKR